MNVRRWMWRGRRWLALALVLFAACRSAPPTEEVQPADERKAGGIATDERQQLEVATLSTVQAAQADEASAIDEPQTFDEQESPDRIILFIGDGMGLPAVAASSYAVGRPLAMMGMPEFGLMATHGYEFVTTDSAASATAMATGEKTHFEGVSVRPSTGPEDVDDDDHQLRSIVDAANEANWKTGLVATVRSTHATPAPFAAHSNHRRNYDSIARSMSDSGVDVLMGAGSEYFDERDDGLDLFAKFEDHGYAVADEAEDVRRAATGASRLVGLMHRRDMPWVESGERKMELNEMVEQSLNVLDRDDPEGFFLMVEGAKIDWGGHRMDGGKVISETVDMDRAVKTALEYARGRSDTLVAVTSDHETGAMDVIDGPTADAYLAELGGKEEAFANTVPEELGDDEVEELAMPLTAFSLGAPEYFGPAAVDDARVVTSFGYFSAASRAYWDGDGRFSAIHTPHFAPVFAEGPGAQSASSVRDNADLGRLLLGWIDGEEPDVERADPVVSSEASDQPENVVLVVGDGLGVSSLSASYYHHGVPAAFELPQLAAVLTHSEDRLVGDAAASATALASGHRTYSGVVGKAPGDEGSEFVEVATVIEEASKRGMKTGIVTTERIADKRVAAFFASGNELDDQAAVSQLAEFQRDRSRGAGIDFMAGGGGELFDEDTRTIWSELGGQVVDGFGIGGDYELPVAKLERGTVASARTRSDDEELATLAEMTGEAIERLGASDEGFFLVVDGGSIGAAKEELAVGAELMEEIRDFDEAVGVAADVAASTKDTLVIATSTHDMTLSVMDNHYGFYSDRCGVVTECGGDVEMEWLEVDGDGIRHGQGFDAVELQEPYSPPMIGLQYTWVAQQLAREGAEKKGPSSANFVPLFAGGAGASAFGGVMDQPQVGKWLVDWASTKVDEP